MPAEVGRALVEIKLGMAAILSSGSQTLRPEGRESSPLPIHRDLTIPRLTSSKPDRSLHVIRTQ
jgi:hypothetical protein